MANSNAVSSLFCVGFLGSMRMSSQELEERFAKARDDNIQKLLQEAIPLNTRKAMDTWLRCSFNVFRSEAFAHSHRVFDATLKVKKAEGLEPAVRYKDLITAKVTVSYL